MMPAHTQVQLEESKAVERLARCVHLEDTRLGRCPDLPFDDLTPDEKTDKRDRAAVAIRLGNPAAPSAARDLADRALQRDHRQHALHPHVTKSMTQTVVAAFLSHLKGYGAA